MVIRSTIPLKYKYLINIEIVLSHLSYNRWQHQQYRKSFIMLKKFIVFTGTLIKIFFSEVKLNLKQTYQPQHINFIIIIIIIIIFT